MRNVFAIPASNAYVERIFSIMNNLWSPERNRLGVDMVKAQLCVRSNLKMTCAEFFNFIKARTDLLKDVRASAKYNVLNE